MTTVDRILELLFSAIANTFVLLWVLLTDPFVIVVVIVLLILIL